MAIFTLDPKAVADVVDIVNRCNVSKGERNKIACAVQAKDGRAAIAVTSAEVQLWRDAGPCEADAYFAMSFGELSKLRAKNSIHLTRVDDGIAAARCDGDRFALTLSDECRDNFRGAIPEQWCGSLTTGDGFSYKAIAKRVRQVADYCERSAGRFALQGLQFESSGDIVGTDGKRLLRSKGHALRFASGESMILPAALMSSRVLEKCELVISPYAGACFFAEGLRVNIRAIDGRFPRWRDVIPSKYVADATIELSPGARREIANNIDRCAMNESEKGKALQSVRLSGEAGKLVMSGEISVEIKHATCGDGWSICLDVDYLRGLLDLAPEFLHVINNDKAFVDDDNASCVVMAVYEPKNVQKRPQRVAAAC